MVSVLEADVAKFTLDDGLALQTIITLGPNVPSGNLIEVIAPAWFEIAKRVKEDPLFIHHIDPRKLEELIAGAYKAAGFDDVFLTPRSGDHGRDIIAIKHGLWSIKIIDQVKGFKPKHKVKANDVRALLGVLSADQSASKAVFSTTSFFAPMIKTDPSIAPFLPTRLELVDRTRLIEGLDAIANGRTWPFKLN